MTQSSFSVRLVLTLSAALLWSQGAADAAETDISNTPISTASNTVVKPNVMFILDDSGSMDAGYSPDAAADFDSGEYGSRSSHCNGMYYNPAITYTPPVDANGVSYANSNFTDAWRNGFKTSEGKTNLTNSYYFTYTGSSPTLGFTYDSSGNVIDTGFYKECDSNVGSAPGYGKFTKVTIDANASAAVKTNFANWYSYYRTRMLTMKTAAGRAFRDIGSNYRVGYSTISYKGTDSTNNNFLKIADFDTTQKASFYSKLYKAEPTSWTPLRGALSKAGRIYAGKLLTGADDPVQYSCQQNFTILSTDGYWNTNEETSSYGPYQIDGQTSVGNQDASLDRPYYDGSISTTVTKTVTTTEAYTTSSCFSGRSRILSTPATTTRTVKTGSNGTVISDVTSGPTTGSATVVVGCTETNSIRALQSPNPSVPVVTTTPTDVSGPSNTLADVAAYYYNIDLRNAALGNCTGALGADIDVCKDNVSGSGTDTKATQHMTTFTLGLGVNGKLVYAENYASGGSADYTEIVNGTKNWPDPIANDGPERIDDLWHAAVNGHGTYFSAQNPDSLVSGISKALAGVSARTGAAASAATSNLEPVTGDNFLFLPLYRTLKWDGDLQAKTVDPSTGAVSNAISWSAKEKLDLQVGATTDSRTIYTFDGGASNKLKEFRWTNLDDTEKGYFNNICSPTAKLSQCTDSSTGTNLTQDQKNMIPGENLVNFIRGQSGFEEQGGNANPIYRDREHVLGDIIGSQPVYVKKPTFSYADENYAAFRDNVQNARLAMVYVAANDGMLHAFEATTGQATSGTEKWTYIPPTVMPNLYKLADKNYATNHQYYVDGSPTIGDICPKAPNQTCAANEWKTILVGGFNAGGKGYYALDITDPSSPKALWNYSVSDDADMGLSFGNPIITKRRDGTWVVVFTSGYNNTGGDGKGHLYVLNANTGTRLLKLSTTAGSSATPSGLAKINAWVDSVTDNTAKRFYGGDMLGNVWRFDTDDRIDPAGREATLLAELGNVSPVGIQPITIKPELTEVSYGGIDYAVVSVGTGRYLGVSDLSDTSLQSIYALKDNLAATGLGKVRTAGVLVRQTLNSYANGTARTTSVNPVDWGTKSGWYIDLNPNNESPGERVNVNMEQQLSLLTVAGNVPENNACTVGGYAWLYSFDIKTGQYVPGSANNMAGRRLTENALLAGLKTIKLDSGKTITLVTDTGGKITGYDDPSSNPGGAGAKRISWRELIN
jgi:type IV pilus assembly protein PilY1